MKIIRFIAGIIGLFIIIPVIAIGIFVATFDANAFKKDIMAQLSQKIGRQVAINGPVKIDFTDGVSVNLKDVVVGSPEGFANKSFANIGDLYVYINWQALLNHAVEVKKLSVSDAQLTLQTNAAGHNNWDLPANKEEEVKKTITKTEPSSNADLVEAARAQIQKTVEEKKADFQINKVELNSIEFKNTQITQINAQGKHQVVVLDAARVTIPASGPFIADVKGKYNNQSMAVNLEAERGVNDLVSGKATPIKLKANYNGEDYEVAGLLARTPTQIDLTNLQTRVKNVDWTGNLRVVTSGAKPFVTGSLATARLDLGAMAKSGSRAVALPQAKVDMAAMPQPKATLIAATSAAPAPDLQALNAVSAELKLAIAQLVANPSTTLDKVSTLVKLNNGRLQLNDLSFVMLGTPYRGAIELDGQSAPAQIRVVMNAKDVDIAALAEHFNSKSPLIAKGDIAADLKMVGLTPESMMQSLSGKMEIALGKGNFDISDQTAVNMMRFLFPEGSVQSRASLTCAAMRFNAANGVLNSNGMVMDTNFATIGGEGSIDLAHQMVNLLLRPVPKESKTASFLVVPVRVSGPTAKPAFAPQQDALVQKVSGLLGGNKGPVSTGVPQVNPAAAGNPCIVALNNPQPIMMTPPTPKEVLKENVQQVKDQISKGKDAINSVKDMLKGGQQPAPATTGQQPAANDPSATINKLKGLFGR